MRRSLSVAAWLALGVACSSGPAPDPLIELSPGRDAGADAAADEGEGCEGFPLDCVDRVAGAPGCCGDRAIDAVCERGVWSCPGGSVPTSDCMFFVPDPACF
ncbi:MAG: hypothetical protein AAF447_25285 [Myxococcota bacterium]